MPCNAEIQTSPGSFKRTFQIYASGGGHQHVYVMFRTKHKKDILKLKLNFCVSPMMVVMMMMVIEMINRRAPNIISFCNVQEYFVGNKPSLFCKEQ
jgi:hypothetical protein